MKRSKGIFYVLMAALLFSIGGLCIKLIPWSPLAINGARNFISAMIIGIYLKVTKHKLVVNPAVISSWHLPIFLWRKDWMRCRQ